MFILKNGKLFRLFNNAEIEQVCNVQQPIAVPVQTKFSQGVGFQRQACGLHCPLFVYGGNRVELFCSTQAVSLKVEERNETNPLHLKGN